MLSSAALWLSARLPQQCLACHTWAQGGPLCAACWATFAPHGPSAPPRCTGCGLALPQGYSGPRCGACLRQPPPWQACHVWVDYAYPWANLLTRWKLHQQPALARPIAHWLGADPAIPAAVAQADVLVPIPLSRQRLRQRGFNQAAQLTALLAPAKSHPMALQRQQEAPSQRGLTRAQRQRNLRQAFHVPPPAAVQGQPRLLVDDVLTTGATVECTPAVPNVVYDDVGWSTLGRTLTYVRTTYSGPARTFSNACRVCPTRSPVSNWHWVFQPIWPAT